MTQNQRSATGRPRLLDLFCGAGGAAMGYHQAGFDVIGVDMAHQPRYPFEFHRADALAYPVEWWGEFDVIHASPPCQRYSMIVRNWIQNTHAREDLVEATRTLLIGTGRAYVIENVEGSPLDGVTVCGSAFGLEVMDERTYLRRHRIFESNVPLWGSPCAHAGRVALGIYGNGTPPWHRQKLGRDVLADEWRIVMGTPWMTKAEMREAVPPAYTRFIGEQLLERIGVAA